MANHITENKNGFVYTEVIPYYTSHYYYDPMQNQFFLDIQEYFVITHYVTYPLMNIENDRQNKNHEHNNNTFSIQQADDMYAALTGDISPLNGIVFF